MRKRFFIKPRLQLKHLLLNLGLIICFSLVGYLIFESIIRSSLPISTLQDEDWTSLQNLLRVGFLLLLFLLSIAVGIENYLLFHSVVGPIYALEKGLQNVARGDLEKEVKIRDTDQLQDVIQSFEEMRKILRERLLTQEKTAQLLTQELENVLANVTVDNISEVRQKLRKIREAAERKAA